MSNNATTSMNVSFYAAILPSLQSFTKVINFYFTAVILLPGWLLNFLTAAVFMRKKFWERTTMGYFYTLNPLFCNLFVTIGILNFFPVSFGLDLTLISETTCRLIWFLRIFLGWIATFFQVQISVDLALNVVYPRKFPWLAKPRNLAKITAIIIIAVAFPPIITLYRHFVYKTTSLSDNTTVTIVTGCVFSSSLQFSFNVMLLSQRLLTFAMILTANVCIVRKLFNSKRGLKRGDRTTGRSLSSKEYTFAFSLIGMNIVSLALVLPVSVVNVLQLSVALDPNSSSDYVAFISQLYSISTWGNYLFEGLLFYINFAFNRLFRAELRTIFFGGCGPVLDRSLSNSAGRTL
jgi:hypothetical protein